MEEIEIWKDVDGYEGLYQISSFGKIKVLPKFKGTNYSVFQPETTKVLGDNGTGYVITHLCKNAIKKTIYVHREVAKYFIPNPENLPEVNHLDGNKTNCRADNLEWSTRLLNEQHAWATGLKNMVGKNHFASKPVLQIDMNGNLVQMWDNAAIAGRALALPNYNIGRCCRGETKQYRGFKWQYA